MTIRFLSKHLLFVLDLTPEEVFFNPLFNFKVKSFLLVLPFVVFHIFAELNQNHIPLRKSQLRCSSRVKTITIAISLY
jgi:hypothetical protein